MKEVSLPGNLKVFALSKADAKVVYHEIYEMGAYSKHGIAVHDGDTIIDAGANIGLFSVNLAQTHKGLTIYLFEPVGQIFRCLEKNMALHGQDNSVRLNEFGLSDKAADVSFEFCPALSMAAGMYSGDMAKHYAKDATMFSWLIALLQDMKRTRVMPGGFCSFLISALKIPVVNVLTALLILIPLIPLLIWIRMSTQKVQCKLKPLSQVFSENNIAKVDLLKVDVEGAEMDVLNGIAQNDWAKINQLIIEVHDVDDRVKKMKQMLKDRNYQVTADQEDWSLHRLMNIYTIYAVKLN